MWIVYGYLTLMTIDCVILDVQNRENVELQNVLP